MSNKEVVVFIIGAFVATLLASFFSFTILFAEEMPVILAFTGATAMLILACPIALLQNLGI